jgi:hypothetical protein
MKTLPKSIETLAAVRRYQLFPRFWSCDPKQRLEHPTDYGAGTPGTPLAGATLTVERWNGLHDSDAAKEAACARYQS